MKNLMYFLLMSSMVLFSTSCVKEIEEVPLNLKSNELDLSDAEKSTKEYFLVANRASSTVSIFNAKNTNYITDITLPDEGAQPTYLAYSKKNKRFYVGDFANNKVVYYHDKDFSYQGEIEIGAGAFHMWINNKINQLWVNNIVSKTTSVIDLHSNTVIATVPLPTDEIPDLTESAVQHDVVISPDGQFAYITILDGPETSYVVQYNTYDCSYSRHTTVGGDAHLLPAKKQLYVPVQNSNEIVVLNPHNLKLKNTIAFPSAHGITKRNSNLFVTGIADFKLGVIDRKTDTIRSETTADFDKPHNVAINQNGKKLFLAHSGGDATKVVFYKVRPNGSLTKISDYDSGLNPFGVLNY